MASSQTYSENPTWMDGCNALQMCCQAGSSYNKLTPLEANVISYKAFKKADRKNSRLKMTFFQDRNHEKHKMLPILQ